MKKMKVLNLYACLGGNRYKWDEVANKAGIEIEVTAVEWDEELARLYQERFPNDIVIVSDAHQYLLDHHKEFDFIWSSPPCQSHSRTNFFTQHIRKKQVYPNMELYEEVIFLKHFSECKYVIENVIPYYTPLIPATLIGRHFFWSNFVIPIIDVKKNDIGTMMQKYSKTEKHAAKKKLSDRQAVDSDLGKHIFETALGIIKKKDVNQVSLFDFDV
jgi:DNA (cytosine-5)-methyltransferase 1